MAASGRTLNFDLPYPIGSDSYAFLSDFQGLATTVDTKLGTMLPKSGGTLTGGLTGTTLNLSSTLNVSGLLTGSTATFSGVVSVGAPSAGGHAATKTYVDAAIPAYASSQSLLTSATAASTYLPLSGGTATGKITSAAPTTSNASINLPHGTSPTTPTNGDAWTTTSGLFVRVNGSTVGPLGTGASGSLPSGGLTGQALIKSSASDYAAGWQDTKKVFVQSSAPAAGSGQSVGDLFVYADIAGSSTGFLPALETDQVIRTVTPGQSIQDAIDEGPGWVFLAPGTHNISTPIEMAKNVRLSGAGPATILNATSAISSVIHVGNEIVRWVVDHMQIQCNSLAQIGVDVATDFAGSSVESEPDCMGRMDLMWIYDAANIGVRHLGGVDVQNCYTSRVRVRRAENYAFWNEGADNSYFFCDGTTNSSTGAGFYAGGANSHYTSCKAWYCRNYGWWTKSTRSMFIGCGSQDTKNHGWYIEYGKSTYQGCIADSAAYGDVGGVLNGADGFYVVDSTAVLVGCLAFDRMQGYPAQQRYGFNLPTAMSGYIDAARPGLGSRVSALHGWQNVSGTFNWR